MPALAVDPGVELRHRADATRIDRTMDGLAPTGSERFVYPSLAQVWPKSGPAIAKACSLTQG